MNMLFHWIWNGNVLDHSQSLFVMMMMMIIKTVQIMSVEVTAIAKAAVIVRTDATVTVGLTENTTLLLFFVSRLWFNCCFFFLGGFSGHGWLGVFATAHADHA